MRRSSRTREERRAATARPYAGREQITGDMSWLSISAAAARKTEQPEGRAQGLHDATGREDPKLATSRVSGDASASVRRAGVRHADRGGIMLNCASSKKIRPATSSR